MIENNSLGSRFGKALIFTATTGLLSGLAGLLGAPWAILALSVLPAWAFVRQILRDMVFLAVLLMVLSLCTLAGTLFPSMQVWQSPWFISLLALGGLSSLVCSLTGWRNRRGLDRLAFLLIHFGLVVLLAGSGLKAMFRVEGMLQLHEGEVSDTLAVQTPSGPRMLQLPFSVQLDSFKVDYYPRKTTVAIFDVSEPDRPQATLDLENPDSARVLGVDVETLGIEETVSSASDAHKDVLLSIARLTVDGIEVAWPVAAFRNDESLVLPMGDRVELGALVARGIETGGDSLPPNTAELRPERYRDIMVVFRVTEDQPQTRALPVTVSFDKAGSSEPLLVLDSNQKSQGTINPAGITVTLSKPELEPMVAPDAGPITFGSAKLALNGVVTSFPIWSTTGQGHAEFPAGNEVPLMQLWSESQQSGQSEAPRALHHLWAVFSQVAEPRAFESRITLLEPSGRPIESTAIAVNEPLIVDGWWLFQADWRRDDPSYSGIQVVRDPGLWVAFAGLFFIALGAMLKVRQLLVGGRK